MAIFVRFSNGNLAHQMTSKRQTARTKVVVSSSVDKMVKEFLRYLCRCGNGAIPPISPETTKNDPTLEPPGGRPFRPGWSEFHSPHNFIHFSYKNVNPVYKFWIELRLKIRPFWPRRKIRTSVRPEVEIKDLDPSTFWYPKRFPIDPRNVGSLADPILEILWRNTFSYTRAPPGDGVENQKSVLQFWRHPSGGWTCERTSRNSVGKCSVPALHARKLEKNKRDMCKIMH